MSRKAGYQTIARRRTRFTGRNPEGSLLWCFVKWRLRHGKRGISIIRGTAVVGVLVLLGVLPGRTSAVFSDTTGSTASMTAAVHFPSLPQAVLPDLPMFYHRFDDGPGTTVIADSSGNGRNSTASVTTANTDYSQMTGPAVGGTAIRTDGLHGIISTEVPTPAPQTFSLELWFRTTDSGKLIGFGDSPTGLSVRYSRHVYVDAGGKLTFGVFQVSPGVVRTVRSSTVVNDNTWHQMTATMGNGTIDLFVDGVHEASAPSVLAEVMDGFWRVGGDKLAGWPDAPPSDYIDALIDEVAIYPTALTATQVMAHYAAVNASDYAAAVLGDNPWAFWRFGPVNPDRFIDASGNGHHAEWHLGPPLLTGQPGTLTSPSDTNGAIRLSGSGSYAVNSYQLAIPNDFTEEIWFKTTTKVGGFIMGFGDSPTGNSPNYDRLVYMTNDGRLVYGVFLAPCFPVTSAASYNDGRWHHVAASLGPAGTELYVDGNLVAGDPSTTVGQPITGYFRVGFDNMGFCWPDRPSSLNFTGYVDEWAVYARQLPASQIGVHYGSGR